MTVKIKIEKFDNGITLKWEHLDGNMDSKAVVAKDREAQETIGEVICDDINSVMDFYSTNCVEMTIEYSPENVEKGNKP